MVNTVCDFVILKGQVSSVFLDIDCGKNVKIFAKVIVEYRLYLVHSFFSQTYTLFVVCLFIDGFVKCILINKKVFCLLYVFFIYQKLAI